MIAPSSRGARDVPQRKAAARRLAMWSAAALLAAASAVAVFVLLGGGTGEPKEETAARQTGSARVAPPLSDPAGQPKDAPVEEEDRSSLEWLRKHDRRYFVPPDAVRRPNGRLYTKDGIRILEKPPARTIRADAGRKKVFRHQAEREIARLLGIEPGKFFVGNGSYGPGFRQSFAEAVASPTPILDDDDEETAALKREVNEVREDLARRLEDGEDVVQIMREAEKELRTLATFRNDMMKELAALRFDEAVTEQDYRDFVEAANRMLRERGLKELSSPAFAEAQLKYIREVRRAKRAAKAGAAQQGN